jgi:alpha-N-arabinofuranosidase
MHYAVAAIVVFCLGEPAQPLRATITVRGDMPPLGEVNRLVFGQNHVAYDPASYAKQPSHTLFSNYGAGLWDPTRRAPRSELLELARQAGMSTARFPGGCGAHRYDWKQTIGDPAARPRWQFGVDEFLRWCEAAACEPVITLSYFAGAESAADLVEYVNAPDDGRNPRGGVDWVARRAANGRRQPYRVRYFEVGNEDYHGDHRDVKSVSAVDYAAQFALFARAMRDVDPTVSIGAIGDDDPWNRELLGRIGRDIDFLIEHTYWPGWYNRNDGKPPAEQLFRDILACPDQIRARYETLARLLDETTGRPGRVPIAVTEYNCPLVQNRPAPYRHSLGNALHTAEMLRVLTQSGDRVLMAHFWQFANEYWGAVRGPVRPYEPGAWVRRPQFYPFQLYADHFQPILLHTEVDCPRYETAGFGHMLACRADGAPQAAAVPYLSVNASCSGDGRRQTVIVVNKHLAQPVETAIRLRGAAGPASARAWCLTGPEITSNNETDPNTVTVRPHAIDSRHGELLISLPPCSCTAIVVE